MESADQGLRRRGAPSRTPIENKTDTSSKETSRSTRINAYTGPALHTRGTQKAKSEVRLKCTELILQNNLSVEEYLDPMTAYVRAYLAAVPRFPLDLEVSLPS